MIAIFGGVWHGISGLLSASRSSFFRNPITTPTDVMVNDKHDREPSNSLHLVSWDEELFFVLKEITESPEKAMQIVKFFVIATVES